MSLFLTQEEVAEFTGIRKGKNHKTREQLQIEWLQQEGIAHTVNARGVPKITTATVIGQRPEKQKADDWSPAVLRVA